MISQVINKNRRSRIPVDPRLLVFPGKFRSPRLSTRYFIRPHLVKMLDADLGGEMTLVCAPAGFGKSILLAQWYEDLLRRNIMAAWLNLDSRDGDSKRCLAHIAAAFKSTGNVEGIGKAGKSITHHNEPHEACLHGLYDYVNDLGSQCVLILDAYDQAASPELNQALRRFLDLMPDNLHLVVATRVTPVELTARLWGEGRLTDLTAPDMCFTEDEITRHIGEKERPLASSIIRITDGWPVAVNLLLEACEDGALQCEENSRPGLPRSIQEFIWDQVLNPLPEFTRDTLLRTSFLEEINPQLADRICRHDVSSRLFGKLHHLNPLISRQDGAGNVYLINPLLRRCLGQALNSLTQTELNHIHTSVIDWYIELRDIDRALYYAKQADSPELFARIVEYFGPLAITIQDGVTSLKLAMEKIQQGSVRGSMRLTISQAVVLIKDGHFSMAERKLEQVDKMIDWNREYEDKHYGSVQADFITAQYLLALYKNENFNREYLDRCEIETYQNSANDGLLGFVHALKSLLYQRNSSFSRAEAEANRSLRYYRTAKSNYGSASVHLLKGMCCLAKGQLDLAMQSYENALSIIKADFPDDPGLNAIAQTLVAEVRYERNELEGLSHQLESAITALESYDGWLDTFIVAYRVASALALSRQDSDSAHMILDREELLAAERSLDEVKRLAQLHRINIHIRDGELDIANNLFQEYSFENGRPETHADPKQLIWREMDEYYFTAARLLIAQQNGEQALVILAAIVQEARQAGRLLSLANGHILQALAYQLIDRQPEAISAMRQAVLIGSSEKYLRSFIDQGERIMPLLQYVIDSEKKENARTRVGKYCSRVLSAYRRESKKGQATLSFTPRERQILIGLNHGSSNKLIARELGVTESTIKFHLKKIYSKLKVNKRSTAVIEARRQHLLT